MNVIEYIEKFENVFDLFESTFETELTSFHFNKPSWESSATFNIMNKNKVESIEKAIMISVIQEFVRFGEFYSHKVAKINIYNKCIEYLLRHYKENAFELIDSNNLKNCVNRFITDTEQKIYMNHEWDRLVTLERIKKLEWVNQNSLKNYHLKSEWNDEDYLFETKDFFIRFNWSTSA